MSNRVRHYKIPDTLDKRFADTEIALRSESGVGIKPMPISYILAYIASAILWFFFISKSFIREGGVGCVVLFSILWLAMTVTLMKRDKTGIPQASLVVSMINYLPKNMRYLVTRNSARANDFKALTGIENINDETGFIEFIDGTCGFMYRVVGTGSILLFEDDKDAILNRCDTFFRKIKTDCEYIFITAKEPQKIYKQVYYANERFQNLEYDDPDLEAIARMNFRYLKEEVGTRHRSIHQYLILKAENPESLEIAKNILRSEVENSSLVFKQCAALFGDDIYDVFRGIYGGKE